MANNKPIQKLEFKLPKLKNQTPRRVKEAYVELYDTYFVYRLDFTADEWINNEDRLLGKKIGKNYWDIDVSKSSVIALELFLTEPFIDDDGTEHAPYKLNIICNGLTNDVSLYFTEKENADKFKQEFKNWWLGE